MGGGLLQRVNRDTMSFATKLSHIVYADGTEADTMKLPKSDPLKYSLPGIMAVKSVGGVPTAFPADGGHVTPEENMLQVVWDNGPVEVGSSSLSKDACLRAQCIACFVSRSRASLRPCSAGWIVRFLGITAMVHGGSICRQLKHFLKPAHVAHFEA